MTEKEIQIALDAVSKGRTTLVMAHRLSTIIGAHKILVLYKGRIAERGSHPTLLKKGGLYAELGAHQYYEKKSVHPITPKIFPNRR